MQRSALLFIPLCLLLAAAAARADVVGAGLSGFLVHLEIVMHRGPAAAWARLVRPQDWWDMSHSYSTDAAKMSLDLTPGGCWCEQLPDGGFVRHMEVISALPGRALRLAGGLGPLQKMGASGTLSFGLKPSGQHDTTVTVEYAVSGYAANGFAEIAASVNEVLTDQLKRLAGN